MGCAGLRVEATTDTEVPRHEHLSHLGSSLGPWDDHRRLPRLLKDRSAEHWVRLTYLTGGWRCPLGLSTLGGSGCV